MGDRMPANNDCAFTVSSIGPAAPEPMTHTTPDAESEESQGPCSEAEAVGYFGTPTASASDHILVALCAACALHFAICICQIPA